MRIFRLIGVLILEKECTFGVLDIPITSFSMNIHQHRITYIFLISALFISMSSITKAQDMNNEFKKKLRESLISPEMQQSQQRLYPGQREFEQRQEVLTVSPTTKLPTRFDRFRIARRLEDKEIRIDLNVTNSTPLNMRPIGSVKFEFDGRRMNARSNAGEMVRPSGMDLDPVRAFQRHNAAKRQEIINKIVRVYGMD